MGQVFSNAELSAIVNNQPNLEREREVSATTRSIEVVNNSAYSLRIEGDTQGELITLPQMASKMIVVNPGQRITYTVLPYSISPATGVLNQQYIAVNETSIANETGIQPLALMPVYTTPVDIQNANIPISGNVDATITNPTVNVAGSVQATIENSTLEVSGNVGVTGGTMDVTINGVPEFNLSAGTNVGISGGTVEVSAGSIQVTNPVQTNSLVKLGTTQFNVFDLANSGSLNLLVAGVATGYFQTIVLEGTSQNGYTYTATANAYNRSTNIGSATLTQSNGPNGEFYASGNLSSKQSFGNVQVGLTAQTTTSATIFNDNMQSGANWATKSGAVTYGPSGATFGANGTLITETQTPQLAPQNLTVQASAQVQNTSVTNTVNGATVVNSAYDTSGNGGRKIVMLSNGWIVTGAKNGTTSVIFYVSKDNGQTWSQLTFFNGNMDQGFCMASNGTTVYSFGTLSNGSSVTSFKFDATTVSNTALPAGPNIDGGQSSFGSGVSLSIDGNGKLWAVWCSKNSTYPNSFNIRVSSSTDGGTTWATPTQVTSVNISGYNHQSPCIVMKSNNVPALVWVSITTGNYSILGGAWNGTTFPGGTIYNSGSASYSQFNPCAVVDSTDVIHVVWHGEDSTDTTYQNVRYSKSNDGGSTWSAMTKLTSGNTQHQQNASITVDPNNNNLYVFWEGGTTGSGTVLNVRRVIYSGGAWGSIVNVTSYTSGGWGYEAQTLWSKFNMNLPNGYIVIWQDAQAGAVKCNGSWTIGSHTMLGVEYWKDAQNYYLLQWSAGNLNLIKVVAGVQTTITSATVNETSTNVTLKLVVASNGNLTGTLSGAGTNSVTGNDTAVTLGSLGITGDNGVVVTNGFISGNYIPSDTVTVDVYAI